MTLRVDVLDASARFITHMNQFVRSACPGAVLTCGNIEVSPGADNVVPREARVWVEYRANSPEVLDKIGSEAESVLRETRAYSGIGVATEAQHRLDPRPMHPAIQRAVQESCGELGYTAMTLSSGALHDAHSMAAVVPSGMIFVPSKGGRSHCPEEDTDPAELVAGANVLLHTISRLALGGLAQGA